MKLGEIKKHYFDARHHPFAYKIIERNIEKARYSDDGEPSLRSGKPIAEAIGKYEFLNSAVVVTRYFGGTKLGVGGLRRAYFEAADLCLKNAEISVVVETKQVSLDFEYRYLNQVLRQIELNNCKVIKNNSDVSVKLLIEYPKTIEPAFRKALKEISNGTIKFNHDI